MTLTASCDTVIMRPGALYFSSKPKLQNINNSTAAVKCRFQSAVNISQEENILCRLPSLDSRKQSYFCRLLDYSSEQKEEYSLR